MKKTLLALSFLGALGFSSCVTRENYLQMPLMSMSERYVQKSLNESAGVPVDVKYCMGDDLVTLQGKKSRDQNFGIVDELLTRAHEQSKSKFIKNVEISHVYGPFSGNCFELAGTGLNYK